MTNPTGSKKNKKKSDERGPNFTPKSTAYALSDIFVTFQRQIKQLKKKWDRELDNSRSEIK